MSLKRVEDFNKVLPILELYTAVQSEGSRQGYPTVVIRTTGCTHRCWFGEGGWCDSWQTSIHPEKGEYTFNKIVEMYDKHPYIKEMMLTGGSPTMHPAIVNELTNFAKERGIVITIETEGSHYLETDHPIDLLSISPKFSNSIPALGVLTPQGKEVDERMIKTHNRLRLNIDAIAQSIVYHKDFHLKPVIDKDLSMLAEFEQFTEDLTDALFELKYNNFETRDEVFAFVRDKVWCMPAGDDREPLFESYPVVMNMCRDKGYKFTGRAHIMAFSKQRYV
jgi:7-carboxy-7-deazaguanine synthase|tara:strand:- start:2144 stop:2977 length:834 start_codon:yes stop_codon:yes gene_type:complete